MSDSILTCFLPCCIYTVATCTNEESVFTCSNRWNGVSIHQIISYYKCQFVTSVYFTHGQQVTLPLQSLLRPWLETGLVIPALLHGRTPFTGRAARACRHPASRFPVPLRSLANAYSVLSAGTFFIPDLLIQSSMISFFQKTKKRAAKVVSPAAASA